VLGADKQKLLANCRRVIFLNTRNGLPPPSHRAEFDRASPWNEANGKYIKLRETGQTASEKDGGTMITKPDK
jgi:hypothetical protein